MTIFSPIVLNNKSRRALTLVEMLVGMAITLVMMAAVVNLFANISEGVRNRRATMEVSANLRIARSQLFNDLAGATCLKYPKNTHGVMPKPDSNNPPDGYFEIVEGTFADENAGGTFDAATSLVPSSNLPFNSEGEPLNPNIVTDGGGLGDYDDILAMTVESESTPFRGQGRGLTPGGDPSIQGDWENMAISSPVAEVIWFAVQTPPRTDPSYSPEMGEPGMRRIYRRTLLVVPWYGTETKTIAGAPVTGSDPRLDLTNTTDYPTFASRLKALRDFQSEFDISVRLENQRLVPNTLADLARREHRFAHMTNPADYPSSTSPGYYPYQFPYEVSGSPPNGGFQQAGSVRGSLYPLGSPHIDSPMAERQGEDLILNDVLAFDVQIYDPGAPLYEYGGSIIQPSGSTAFTDPNSTNDAIGSGLLTGFGTYVDLGWNNGPGDVPDYKYFNITGAPQTLFQQERQVGWRPGLDIGLFRGTPAVYDTWTTYYETDAVDQNNFDGDNDVTTGADEGANGLDDPAPYDQDNDQSTAPAVLTINGPDDPGERETSPPYPSPLYGVQVKLRVYEPESRQIRETTVTRNLAK